MDAWCFDDGTLHRFHPPGGAMVYGGLGHFRVASEEQAIEAKQHAYRDARFFDEFPGDKQLEVIEICETWTWRPGPVS